MFAFDKEVEVYVGNLLRRVLIEAVEIPILQLA